jgi:prepilin-type processing-associated H-X9-DG protein
MAAITDGTTNTYLVGERYINTDSYYDGSDMGAGFSPYVGHGFEPCRWTYCDPNDPHNPAKAYVPRQDQSGLDAIQSFGSAHAGSLNMSFCDGSVRSIGYSIDAQIHCWLGDRRDGQPVDAGQF